MVALPVRNTALPKTNTGGWSMTTQLERARSELVTAVEDYYHKRGTPPERNKEIQEWVTWAAPIIHEFANRHHWCHVGDVTMSKAFIPTRPNRQIYGMKVETSIFTDLDQSLDLWAPVWSHSHPAYHVGHGAAVGLGGYVGPVEAKRDTPALHLGVASIRRCMNHLGILGAPVQQTAFASLEAFKDNLADVAMQAGTRNGVAVIPLLKRLGVKYSVPTISLAAQVMVVGDYDRATTSMRANQVSLALTYAPPKRQCCESLTFETVGQMVYPMLADNNLALNWGITQPLMQRRIASMYVHCHMCGATHEFVMQNPIRLTTYRPRP